jgi:hypothetical protein
LKKFRRRRCGRAVAEAVKDSLFSLTGSRALWTRRPRADASKESNKTMRLQHLAVGFGLVTIAAAVAVTAAPAANGIFIPLFTYRTGPFAGSGIPIANGMADYFTRELL